MGDVIVSNSNLKALADVIRLKSGKSDLMTLDSMPNRIRRLPGRVSDEIVVSDLCRGTGTEYFSNVALRALPLLKTTGMTDMSSMFKNLNSSDTVTAQSANYLIDVAVLDTSSATNMSSMFEGATGDIEGIFRWDTSSVTNMSSMFKSFYVYNSAVQLGRARTIEFGNMDTSNVTDFSHMFDGFKFRTQITPPVSHYLDLNSFDTSSATTMADMFYHMEIPGGDGDEVYLWVPSTFIATQISNNGNKPFYRGPTLSGSKKLQVYTDATDAESQGWGTINSGFDMHYNSTHADFLDLVNS